MTQKTCREKYLLEYDVNRLTAENIHLKGELGEVKEKLALAEDGIRIALNIVGYNIAEMNQFERASAILDMAHELAALTEVRQCNTACDICSDTLCGNHKGDAMRV